jgi:excinuclease ABC subunit C
MASKNAKLNLVNDLELVKLEETKTLKANDELKDILNLDKLDRIELFDNSNLFGTFNVSGMVVFKNGIPAKNEYRKYKITKDVNDDYGTMKEVIYRRYYKVLMENLEKPDLIIVDGGIGQMNIAKAVLNELNMNIKVVGLKKDNHHNTNALIDDYVEIDIEKSSNLFLYLTRMQDEVHKYTINYHKQIRSKGALSSIIDNVEGIGPKRKRQLLAKYKTINNIKAATDLDELIGKTAARNLIKMLKDKAI